MQTGGLLAVAVGVIVLAGLVVYVRRKKAKAKVYARTDDVKTKKMDCQASKTVKASDRTTLTMVMRYAPSSIFGIWLLHLLLHSCELCLRAINSRNLQYTYNCLFAIQIAHTHRTPSN